MLPLRAAISTGKVVPSFLHRYRLDRDALAVGAVQHLMNAYPHFKRPDIVDAQSQELVTRVTVALLGSGIGFSGNAERITVDEKNHVAGGFANIAYRNNRAFLSRISRATV